MSDNDKLVWIRGGEAVLQPQSAKSSARFGPFVVTGSDPDAVKRFTDVLRSEAEQRGGLLLTEEQLREHMPTMDPLNPYDAATMDEMLKRANATLDAFLGWPELQPQSTEGSAVPSSRWLTSEQIADLTQRWGEAMRARHGAFVVGGGAPVELPLSKALGPSWRFFEDKAHATTVLLHDSGLWLEADAESLWSFDAQAVEAVSAALSEAVAKGISGRCMLETTQRQTPDPENPGRVLVDELLARVLPVPERRPFLVLDLSRAERIHWEQVERLAESVQRVLETSGAVEFKGGPMEKARELLAQGAQLLADAAPSELQRQWLASVHEALQPQSVKPTDGEGE